MIYHIKSYQLLIASISKRCTIIYTNGLIMYKIQYLNNVYVKSIINHSNELKSYASVMVLRCMLSF